MGSFDQLKTELHRVCPGLLIKEQEPMRDYTSFRIGGPADLMVCPTSGEAVAETVRFCRGQEIPWFIIGNGSNLLVSDEGYRGVTILNPGSVGSYYAPTYGVVEAEDGLIRRMAIRKVEHPVYER